MTQWAVPARVVRVVDGDTLILDLDLGWRVWRLGERCRLRGINAPELPTEAGQDAAAYVSSVLKDLDEFDGDTGHPLVIFISTGLDKYGRPLGIVRLADGRILNDMIMDAGHATRA